MRVRVLETGSSGNCYILTSDSGKMLILDIGVTKKDILKAINYQVMDLSGIIITHSHADHLNKHSCKGFEMMGIPVWKPYMNLESGKIRKTYFDQFRVTSFDVPHDGTPCCGYLIESDGKKILYVTDAEYIKYNFRDQKLHTIIIECNYQADYVNMDAKKAKHVLKGHMELNTCIDFLKANQTDELKNVILCHTSWENANMTECLEMVRKTVTASVTIAQKGMDLEL